MSDLITDHNFVDSILLAIGVIIVIVITFYRRTDRKNVSE